MLLNEKQVAQAVGLPGPVVSELLYLGRYNFFHSRDANDPQFDDLDLKRAELAARMLSQGVRWAWVKLSIDGVPQTHAALDESLDLWRDPRPRRGAQRLREAAIVAALAVVMAVIALVVVLGGLWLGAYGLD